MFKETVNFVQNLYETKDFITLHQPFFTEREKDLVIDCIDSTFVSSVGAYVNKFELAIAEYTGAKYAIAVVNGTNSLHLGLLLAGVNNDDEVLTQAFTFIATANAIKYANAHPVFIDINKDTLGLCPQKLEAFLENNTFIKDNACYNKESKRKISACVPMHSFGHAVKIEEIANICEKYHIALVEDAAESLGSKYKGKHTGNYGLLGIISFNGNKIITTGGGGIIITNDETIAKKAKHLTTQAKIPHKWEFVHDDIGYNYRMPNLNAALGVAQMEKLPVFVEKKRELALIYKKFFDKLGVNFFLEPENSSSNYWLNAILLENKAQRDEFLTYTNENNVMTRPAWQLMNRLEMFKNCQTDDLKVSEWVADRLVNIPSWVKI